MLDQGSGTPAQQPNWVAIKKLWERELLRFRDLKALGIVEDRATLRRRMGTQNEDPFPGSVILSPNSVAWVTSEVRAWLDRRPRGVAPQPRHLAAERSNSRNCLGVAGNEPGLSDGNAKARLDDVLFSSRERTPSTTFTPKKQRARAQARVPMSVTPLAGASAASSPSRPLAANVGPPGWRVVGLDSTGKRVAAVCGRCEVIRQFGADAFAAGSVAACDCARRPVPDHSAASSFAADVARIEGGDALKRTKARR